MREWKAIDWSDAALGRLRRLWAEGVSTQEIGLRLGAAKSSVGRKARLLGLPGRQSPITRNPDRKRAVPRAVKNTTEAVELPPAPPRPQVALFARGGSMPSVHALVPTTPARACQFPSWGDDEKPTHIYCSAPVERDESGAPTGSYCCAHRAVCYVRTRRQECAA